MNPSSSRRAYLANKRRVVLTVDPTLQAEWRPEGGWVNAPSATGSHGAESAASDDGGFRVPGENFTLHRVVPGAAPPPAEAAPGHDGLTGAGEGVEAGERLPVFRLGRDHHAIVADRILVRLRPAALRAAGGDPGAVLRPLLDRLLGAEGYQVIPRERRTAVVKLRAYADPLKICSRLRRHPGVSSSVPDVVTLYSPVPRLFAEGVLKAAPELAPGAENSLVAANDPLLSGQQALAKIGAIAARDRIGGGSKDVVVAVVDAMIDTDHPDLRGVADPVVDVLEGEAGELDGHATACAGLAVAIAENGVGVRGVAAGCRLLPVRFAHSAPGFLSPSTGSADAAAQAIDRAWREGAWVISLSWVFAEWPEMARAIRRARRLGRCGKGCVVVAGVGNDGTSVYFPARLKGVLAVAACNDEDMPKTQSSNDGQTGWSSCRGREVMIAAPGVRNLTTDVTGERGYNLLAGPAGDYVTDFRGTSSSTPLVAGAAAMVLSANPCLTEAQVRDILCKTAIRPDKLKWKNDRNNQMGFGRVNVAAAVERALEMKSSGEVPCEK